MLKKLILALLLVTAVYSFISSYSFVTAQTTISGVAFSLPITNENVQNGDLICSDKSGYSLCVNAYDSSMYGVVNDTPTTSIGLGEADGTHLVGTNGELTVRVSTINGKIAEGDFVTSSQTAGVAQLADKTGYVLGRALDGYDAEDTNEVGTIKVAIAIHAKIDAITTVRQNLVELLGTGFSALGVGPIAALRYIIAATMVLVSFTIGFIYFGRIAITGIQAIGRNPLAIGRIQLSVIINIAIMIVISLVGLATAYLILVI